MSVHPVPASRPVEVVAVIPAKDEEGRIGATIAALEQIGAVGPVVVVDDGSLDQTAAVAEWTGGVEVVRHERNRGKAAAMTTGAARAAELAPGAPVLFVDADLEGSAGSLAAVVAPVLAGEVEMAIAVLPPQERPGGGFGIVVRTAREGIRRLTGWSPVQPLSGQRCLTREALDAAMPLASGWGVEVGLTVDVLRSGGRVVEVPCELHHRVTGRDLRSQVHRARQLADVVRALADRSGARERVTDTLGRARSAARSRATSTAAAAGQGLRSVARRRTAGGRAPDRDGSGAGPSGAGSSGGGPADAGPAGGGPPGGGPADAGPAGGGPAEGRRIRRRAGRGRGPQG